MSRSDETPLAASGEPSGVAVSPQVPEGEDHTSRMRPAYTTTELPALPVETQPVLHRAVAATPAMVYPSHAPEHAAPVRAFTRGHDDLIGRRCGGYIIDSLLGEGGMGRVYQARNPRLGKRVAVKVISDEHSRDPRNIDRFLQEAKAAAQLDDPNIIDVLDASELEDGQAYLLMPFVEGPSLEELCDQLGPMPFDVAATILLQICGGLEAAHSNGIIHRDIKPQNILVGPRQQRQHFVRIVDFGIAKLLDPHLAGQFRTHTKAMMGTPGYMAPEQARGDSSIDARADIYAVAVVAYRMLTGRRPYMDETLFGLIQKQATDAPFPRPLELRPDLPPEWDEAIMAALVNDRAHRLPTIRELAQRLARGIPQGEAMLRLLVPRFADAPLPPHAPTLERDLDHGRAVRAVELRRQPQAPPPPTSSRRMITPWQLVLALVGAIALTLGGLAAAGWLQPATTPPSPPSSSPLVAAPPPPPERAPVQPPTSPPAAAPAPAPSLPEADDAPPTAPAAPASPDDRAAPAPAPPGMLSLDVVPWAYVSIDGKRVGTTPYRGKLAPGRHTVRISNPDGNKTFTVTIVSSRTATVNESLQGK